jgi:hypothetical protein
MGAKPGLLLGPNRGVPGKLDPRGRFIRGEARDVARGDALGEVRGDARGDRGLSELMSSARSQQISSDSIPALVAIYVEAGDS